MRLFIFLFLVVLGCSGRVMAADEPAPAKVVTQGTNAFILLHARDASIHGTTVRYEPQTNKNTIGYWTKAQDWVSWDFEVSKPGTYSIEILYGCGNGSGGSDVDFLVGDQKLSLKVEQTGGFQNFKELVLGEMKFDKTGSYTLAVKPQKKPGTAVMDLRSVTLKPKL